VGGVPPWSSIVYKLKPKNKEAGGGGGELCSGGGGLRFLGKKKKEEHLQTLGFVAKKGNVKTCSKRKKRLKVSKRGTQWGGGCVAGFRRKAQARKTKYQPGNHLGRKET